MTREHATTIRDRALAWLEHHGAVTPADDQISLTECTSTVGGFRLRSWQMTHGCSESLEIWRGADRLIRLVWNRTGYDVDGDELEMELFDGGYGWQSDFLRQVSAARPEGLELYDFAGTFEANVDRSNYHVRELLDGLRPAAVNGRADIVARIVGDVAGELANEQRGARRLHRSRRA